MGKNLYLECYSGISGDMTVAALLDLGADQEVLTEALHSLPLQGFEIEISRVKKSGLDACDFAVILDEAHENHDHDMEYLYGRTQKELQNKEAAVPARMEGASKHVHDHKEDTGHMHSHEEDPQHMHSHEEGLQHMHSHEEGSGHIHSHGSGHSHAHEHRGLPDILKILAASNLTDHAKELAGRIFQILAAAEAKAHGVPLEEVHFHEVGAVDSIVDIAAAAVCLDNLQVTDIYVSELYEGRGFVRCQHGVIPVPVPAVTNIAAEHGICLHITEDKGEFVTPTGAAIAALRTKEKVPERFTIERTGLGAGKRICDTRTGILRAMLIQEM